jgi:hypothetical protein
MESKETMYNDCVSTGCGWKCCGLCGTSGILMLPQEYEKFNVGETGKHLEVLDDNYLGGKIVKCNAKDTSNCDGGYKPIQCSVYPLWKKDEEILHSTRCPMTKLVKAKHVTNSIKLLDDYAKLVDITEFLKNAKVNSYEKID